jgi:UDP-N-acetylglucosamine--N-acetylmuramyl-(pentapeptide) pyrophosphoryl-undecaprenol N-acetylglucosamine transferase
LQNTTNIRVMIAGGGTGGHIFPAVAIANALMTRNAQNEILFVGALGKMEMEKVPKEGFKIIGLPIAGFNRSNMFKNITLPFKLIRSLFLARKAIKNFKPDVVVGVGGYASYPILSMAQKMGIPSLIQEQNSYAGKSNMQLGKKANSICVAYTGMNKFFNKNIITVTGNPVRSLIVNANVNKQEAFKYFDLQPNKKTILIIGGSLGAKSINDTIIAQHKELLNQDAQILWQTGKTSFALASKSVTGLEKSVKVHEFIQAMDKAYAVADVVISRAGALSIAELCIVAKPVVFVPYPHASEDHQTVNAMALVNNNASCIVKDAEVNTKLISTVISLLNDENKCKTFSKNLKKMAIIDADERIVNQLYTILK